MNDLTLCEIISRKLNGVDNILDIGCGDGFLVSCLAKKLNKKILGLDTSTEGFTECIGGDAHNMKMFKNNEFDAVTLVYALHHMDDPYMVLKEAKRVLKLDGKILIAEYIVRKRGSKCYKFVRGEINKMMENSGFRDTIIQKLEEDFILVTSKK